MGQSCLSTVLQWLHDLPIGHFAIQTAESRMGLEPEVYFAIQTVESRMGLTDTHQWTGPTHKGARCGRFRWWWHRFWHQHCASRPTLIEWVVGFSLTHNEECIETVSMHKYSIYWNCQYIHVYSSIFCMHKYSTYWNCQYIQVCTWIFKYCLQKYWVYI